MPDLNVGSYIIEILNSELKNKTKELKHQILHAAELFSQMENEGFEFLKGFKIAGKIYLEKKLFHDEEDYIATKKEASVKKYPEWEKVKDYYKKWHDLDNKINNDCWMLTYDSTSNSFTPYSEYLMENNKFINATVAFPFSDKMEVCSYLNNFCRANEFLSGNEFLECNINDFKSAIYVLLNNDCKNLNDFKSYDFRIQSSVENTILSERRYTLNKEFNWSSENVQKILTLNKALWKKTNELKKNLTLLRNRFLELSKTDELFSDFYINAEIEYQNKNNSTEIADEILLQELKRNTFFGIYSLHCCNDFEIIDEIHEDKNFNWNFEVFKNHLTDKQKKIPFHYFMHGIFIDGNTYSFEDLVRMKPSDLVGVVEICL